MRATMELSVGLLLVLIFSFTKAEISPPQCDHDQFGDCFSTIVQSVYHLNEEGILLTDEDEDSICRISKENLECVENMYKLCLDEDGQDGLNKLILRTKAAIAKSCMENRIKGDVFFSACFDSVETDVRRCNDMLKTLNNEIRGNIAVTVEKTEINCAQQEFIRCVERDNIPNDCKMEDALYLRNRLTEQIIAIPDSKYCYDSNICDENKQGYIGDLIASIKTAHLICNILYILLFSLLLLILVVCYFLYIVRNSCENPGQIQNIEMVELCKFKMHNSDG